MPHPPPHPPSCGRSRWPRPTGHTLVRRVLLPTVAVLAAILLQVTVLNNLPFPGGSPPDLVLVVVVALALAGGPLDGAVIGFAAGLAVDIAPPSSGLVGQSALVFCLVGF